MLTSFWTIVGTTVFGGEVSSFSFPIQPLRVCFLLILFVIRWTEKKICILCLLSTLFKDREEDNRKWSLRKMPNITVKQVRWLLRNKCIPCLLFWRLAHCPHTKAPPYCRYTTMISITMTKNETTAGVNTWGCPTHLNTHTVTQSL